MGSQSKSVVQLGQSECGRHSEGLVVCRVGESGANLSSSRPLFLNRKKKREKKSGVVVLVLGRASGSLFFCFVSMWLKPSQVTSKSFKITHSENLNQENHLRLDITSCCDPALLSFVSLETNEIIC